MIETTKQQLNWLITNDFGGKSPVALEVKLEDWDYTAYIKWDGCCEITKVNACMGKNGLEDDSIHICDVPQFIEVLQSLEEFRMENIEGAE